MNTACFDRCPRGNAEGKWVQYGTTGWGCCKNFWQCGGHKKRCRFECNAGRRRPSLVVAPNKDELLRRLSFSERIEDQLEELDIAGMVGDRAREALLTDPAPRNWRERIARAARDATIRTSINLLENQIERKEDETVEFIVELVESHEKFLETNYGEWQSFITEQSDKWEVFIAENGAELQDLLADPSIPAIEAFANDNGEEVAKFLKEQVDQSQEFFEDQVDEAMEFLETNTESVKSFTEGHLKFLTDSAQTVVMLADLVGLEHEGIDMLEDFAADPTEFIVDQARKFIMDRATSAREEITERMLEIAEEYLGEGAVNLVERIIEAMEEFSLEAAAAAAADVIEDMDLDDFVDYAEDFFGDEVKDEIDNLVETVAKRVGIDMSG